MQDRIAAARKASANRRGTETGPFGDGQYDAVAVVEAPNDEKLTKVALAQAALGAFRSTETMPAFTEKEVARIVAGLP